MILNNSLGFMLVLCSISYFDSTFAHNIHRRNTDKSSCPPLNETINGINVALSKENLNSSSPVPNNTVFGFICENNYELSPNVNVVACINGSWNTTIPTCVPSGKYNEAQGNENDYYCGDWDGTSQAPWHVGIYQKKNNQYVYFCGGSIVSPNVIVTAAHCFTDDNNIKINPSEIYIGAGKHKSDYNYQEWSSQYNTVKKYAIPDNYRGADSNLDGDIGLLILNNPFKISYYVHPACIDWENQFENQQLAPGNIGNVQGWGYTNLVKKTPSPTLQQLNVPVIAREECLDTVPTNFHKYVTNDKFCAGYTNGSCICNGDDGGGLVFRRNENNVVRYYIRGLISTYPKKNNACDMYQYAVYTKISSYKDFIQQVVNENKVKKQI